jgi:hypothetical protein
MRFFRIAFILKLSQNQEDVIRLLWEVNITEEGAAFCKPVVLKKVEERFDLYY